MKRLNKFYVFFLIATFSCIDIQAQQPTGPSIEFQYIQYCYDTILQDSNGECFLNSRIQAKCLYILCEQLHHVDVQT